MNPNSEKNLKSIIIPQELPTDVPVRQSLDQEDHTKHVLLVLPIFGILSLPGVCSVVSKILLGLRGVEDLSSFWQFLNHAKIVVVSMDAILEDL